VSTMEDVVAAIKARLVAAFPAIEVEDFPDEPDQYVFVARDQKLLVAYERSTFGTDPESIAPLSLPRTPEFSVTVLVRSLRGPTGATQTIDDVIRALFGWRPTKDDGSSLGVGPLMPTKDELLGQDQGTWRFVISFTASTVAVEDRAALTGAPLSQVTWTPKEGTPA
jgi:hypothetical protein